MPRLSVNCCLCRILDIRFMERPENRRGVEQTLGRFNSSGYCSHNGQNLVFVTMGFAVALMIGDILFNAVRFVVRIAGGS